MGCRVDLERRDGGAVILALDGEVDMENAERVGGKLLGAVPAVCRKVVLDLDRARYFDSSGIRMLYDVSEQIARRGASLLLALSPAAPLRRLLELTKLDTLIPVHDSVEAALADCGEVAGSGYA